MSTIRRIDIANEYNVSSGTVTRWIELANEGRNNLQLTIIKDKPQVLDNPNNRAELQKLKDEGNKFKSHVYSVQVQPNNTFYDVFSNDEIVELINVLEIRNEIPNKFTFKNDGANIWDQYYKKNALNSSYPTPQRVNNLLNASLDFLLYRIKDFESVNVIDIGQGNSYPVKIFLERLFETGKLKKYIAIDVGLEMNDYSRKNVNAWLPELEFKSYVADVEKTYFSSLFLENKDDLEENKNINIVLYLGSMIGMHEDRSQVLKNFRDGLGNNDILVLSNTIDSIKNRVDFSYVKNPEGDRQNIWIPEMLGIDVEKCSLISKFNEKKNIRELNLKLDKDYYIGLQVFGKKKIIHLTKDSEVNLWRHEMSKIPNLVSELEEAHLRVIGLNIEHGYSHVLIMCEAFKA
jgi:Histidine-specific methyltransferase, SAM-dependent